ncbi:HK97 gp10 family phage protein [Tepidibacillus fermentans]|uniref:Bacteriophage HK97-gp10 putative tail-component n=1 Tax=Tepidibacillus fermentans TaxID=1281767 RepID=A0A4R3KB62_9BACI|nr:HK97 gp10 family phage protein [Tepidibacillus fermentans]TCS80376.1 bacteriophage HK97-gp10 putative tail-component [Tepidibacillus fermentans]
MANFNLRWDDTKAKTIAKMAATNALMKCAADLQRKSAEQAPIDTGDLRANCSVSPLKVNGNKLEVRVGYDLPYAIVQHERLDFNHPKGGGPKYLENPFNENKAKYHAYIDKVIKDTLRVSD